MKKIIIAFFLLLAIGIIQSYQQPPKMYKVQTDIETWKQVLKVIDYSTIDPQTRISVREFIIGQLNDTTINK